MGTDAAVMPHGWNLNELMHMANNGFTPEQALHATTLSAAELLGWQGRLGALEPGQVAKDHGTNLCAEEVIRAARSELGQSFHLVAGQEIEHLGRFIDLRDEPEPVEVHLAAKLGKQFHPRRGGGPTVDRSEGRLVPFRFEVGDGFVD